MKKYQVKKYQVKDTHILAETRLLVKQGGAVYLSMPQEWLRRHNLKPGDRVPVVADGVLKVVPVSEEV